MPRRRQHVLCPSCGDPVPGPFPRSGECIHCTHRQEMFPFHTKGVETAPIEYHASEGCWMVILIHSEMDGQARRILDCCTLSVPGCIVHIMPIGPDSFKFRAKDGEYAY
jgi:hypothetical protein